MAKTNYRIWIYPLIRSQPGTCWDDKRAGMNGKKTIIIERMFEFRSKAELGNEGEELTCWGDNNVEINWIIN